MATMNVSAGSSAHPGAVVTAAGVNFCVYSKHATRVELLLFDREDAADPCHVVELDPLRQRTYHYWHCQITGIGPGQIYSYASIPGLKTVRPLLISMVRTPRTAAPSLPTTDFARP
jgi:pullulanase/glycogen debranching enzyme